jgi:hypothetical protein
MTEWMIYSPWRGDKPMGWVQQDDINSFSAHRITHRQRGSWCGAVIGKFSTLTEAFYAVDPRGDSYPNSHKREMQALRHSKGV